MLGRTKQRTSDENLINSDEILRSLTHRAAYRAQTAMRWILLPGALVLTQLVQDETWNIVGYTMFVVFFVTTLFFEVILAYDGVLIGLDELRRNVVISKRTVFQRVGWIFAYTIGISLLFGHFTDDDPSVIGEIVNGIVLGAVISSMYLYRWRHIVDRKSR
jgi:hypothetical protein